MLIEFTGVSRTYSFDGGRVKALRGVDFSVAEGELVAVMGPSGSGKSTLLQIAGGLDVATSGLVRCMGVDMGALGKEELAKVRRTVVGYVFQDLNLIPSLTAVENVAAPRELDGVRPRRAWREAGEVLAAVGVPELADRFPAQMSGGQQQRVAIARALVGGRKLLLADEPTGALDQESGYHVMRVLREAVDGGRGGVVVTHDQAVAGWADRVVHLRDGRVVEQSAVGTARSR